MLGFLILLLVTIGAGAAIMGYTIAQDMRDARQDGRTILSTRDALRR